MFLTSVSLTNYRCFKALTVALEPRMNVIVGVNGSGKTSLLMGIHEALHGVTSLESHLQALNDPAAVRMQATNTAGRIRFEAQYPVEVGAHAQIEGWSSCCIWRLNKSTELSQTQCLFQDASAATAYESIRRDSRNLDPDIDASTFALPIIAFYRANRQWNTTQKPTNEDAATLRNSRFDAYIKWQDASLDVLALQSWVIKKSLERFEISSQKGLVFEAITDDELAVVNSALSHVLEGAKGLRYNMRQSSILVDWHDQAATPFDLLSAGQRAIVGLVADIARRMCLLNPQLGMDVTQQTPGVVLIDEIDLHLHPKWQQTILGNLGKAFPKVQFMVTTHSPQVLSTVKNENIRVLEQTTDSETGEQKYEIKLIHQQTRGVASADLLAEIMGVNPVPTVIEAQQLSQYHALIQQNLHESDDGLALRTQLDAHFGADHPALLDCERSIRLQAMKQKFSIKKELNA